MNNEEKIAEITRLYIQLTESRNGLFTASLENSNDRLKEYNKAINDYNNFILNY